MSDSEESARRTLGRLSLSTNIAALPTIREEDLAAIRKKEVSLRPYQIPCVRQVLDVWKKGLPAIITALTGAGKTYMSAIAAYASGAEYVVVLGPKSSLNNWQEVLSIFFPGNRIFCYGYDAWKFCGTKNCRSDRQPFTEKIKARRTNGTEGYDFEATDKWNEMVWDHKTVMILDEFHNLQKQSQRTFSVAANTRSISCYKCPSRILALSFTPCDNIADVPTHLYLLGLTEGANLAVYNSSTRVYDTRGLDNLLELAESFGEVDIEDRNDVTNSRYLSGRSVHRRVNSVAGALFLRYIRRHLVFSCVPDFVNNPAVAPRYSNLFCRVSNKAHRRIQAIIGGGGGEEKIPEAFEHQIEVDTVNMAILTSIQQKLEKIKLPLYLRLAQEWLENHPNSKVIILILFLDTLDALVEGLREYNPVTLEGDMSIKERNTSIRIFQAYNLDSRVMIGTIKTGGESINLHDTSPDGSFPRCLFIPPCFYTKYMIQSAGRVFRDSISSHPYVSIVYTCPADTLDELEVPNTAEKRFYEAVRRKTDTVKQYHAEGQNSTLPCDYPSIITEQVYKTCLDSPLGE